MLLALLHHSHVTLYITYLKTFQELANFQECGLSKHQYAT